jgi:carbon starvation protein
VAVLDDANITPAHRLKDGHNYDPTNKWVLFGHHFAAISGAGPLIGPVLAIQYGYMPGLLWLVIGVCLAGAVQDMLVMAASVRYDGKSLAEIARNELGPWARVVVSAAILFIVVIALAGLGFVVVKALGGEEVRMAEGTEITLPDNSWRPDLVESDSERETYEFPKNCKVRYPGNQTAVVRAEAFRIQVPASKVGLPFGFVHPGNRRWVTLPNGSVQIVKGSSWGMFTIACTIPIALFVGFYMYRVRKGKVVEASLIGASTTIAAVVVGNWIPGSPLEGWFSLSKENTIFALTGYGFIASVLPVWLLLCPRDYLSSFLKIGTIALLVVGVFAANPVLPCPMVNEVFQSGGPTFKGAIFPFVFICIMCGAVSGFHALVASGTTPKMVDKETQVRTIGYGAMLMEGLVGVVALIAAASLDPETYYSINVSLADSAKFQEPLDKLYRELGNVDAIEHLPLAQIEEKVGGESLRGRTGGAVTLAVGMSLILSKPLNQLGLPFDDLIKYWYHFAIMFEALFILTTIDAGTRIARFLLQEAMGQVHPRFGKTDWWPGAVFATAVVTFGWGALVWGGSINTIWPMFGIANQLLAVIALCLLTTRLVNSGMAKYAPVTLLPMLFVATTTLTAGSTMLRQFAADINDPDKKWTGILNFSLTLFVIVCVATLLLMAVARWLAVLRGVIPARTQSV